MQWEMGSTDRGWVTLGVREVCFEVGSVVGTTLGERGEALSVWTWGSLVGLAEGVDVESETQGIEVIGHIIMGGEFGGVYGTTLGYDTGSVVGTTIGSGTGDVRAMEYLH